ncbi:MAG: glycosyltransferase family 2 protein [Deltaproteobacteria bacterium]|nr:glycosyltransferase family 2 protein [Deltaproteobacteria bacterium]
MTAGGPKKQFLSAIVIAQDEEGNIERCLSSLGFCDEIVVVDGGSKDRTPDIARAMGAKVLEHPFDNMNAQKDRARKAARGEWVFNLDADEVVPGSLAIEIRETIKGSDPEIGGFLVPRKTLLNGKWLRWGGYYPDRQLRLVRKERARWDERYDPHDKVVLQGSVRKLKNPMLHYAARDMDYLKKRAQRYGLKAAVSMHERGVECNFLTPALHSAARFLKSFFLKGGMLMGGRGLTLAGYQAYEVLVKYKGLAELNKNGRAGRI